MELTLINEKAKPKKPREPEQSLGVKVQFRITPKDAKEITRMCKYNNVAKADFYRESIEIMMLYFHQRKPLKSSYDVLIPVLDRLCPKICRSE